MKLSTIKRLQINSMIDSQTFYGIPLEHITPNDVDDIDVEDAITLYIVANMLGWELRDKESYNSYPYAAEEYLKKFQIKYNPVKFDVKNYLNKFRLKK